MVTFGMIEEKRSLGLQKLAVWKDAFKLRQLTVGLICGLV